MARMIVVDRDGKEHEIEAKTGLKIMEVLRELDYGVAAICGGLCSCAGYTRLRSRCRRDW